jgi:hypothetical protein
MSTATILRDINALVIDAPDARLSDTCVWLVTADTFAIGHGDLDNRTALVGVWATLDAVARDLPLMMVQQGARIFNPIITQAVVMQ